MSRVFGIEIGFELALFLGVCEGVHFHNPLYYIDLRSFDFFGNWVFLHKKLFLIDLLVKWLNWVKWLSCDPFSVIAYYEG